MDIKVVYDKEGNDKLHDTVRKMTDHLDLQDRLVTVYHPRSYGSLDERFDMEYFQEVIGNSVYSRFVEYGS